MMTFLKAMLLAAAPLALIAPSIAQVANKPVDPSVSPAVQEPSTKLTARRARIEDLFVVLQLDQTFKRVMEQSYAAGAQAARGLFATQSLSPADEKLLADYQQKMIALLSEELSWDKLRPAMVDLYASSFSAGDIESIIAFYQSPAGQNFIARTPDLMSKASQITLDRMQVLQPQMQALMTDMQKQIAANHKFDLSK